MANLLPYTLAAALILASLFLGSLSTYFRQWRSKVPLEETWQSKHVSEDQAPLMVTKEVDFPEDWWTSEKRLALEKRALFSKAWLYTAHASCFSKPGAYRSVNTPAGYPIFLIRGKDDVIRAFHNFCRHRAYAVTSKPSGASLVLGCRYHGWSYDTKGRLIKAPKFEDVPGFEKEANSLFEVKCFTDRDGMVYVNLDASDNTVLAPPAPSLGKPGLKASIVETWEVEGSFNWKLAEKDDAFVFPSLRAFGSGLFSLVTSVLKDISSTHVRPSVLSHVFSWPSRSLVLVFEMVPLCSRKTIVRCHALSGQPFARDVVLLFSSIKDDILASVNELEMEHVRVKESCEIAHLDDQITILAQIKVHAKLERIAGQEIKPAARNQDLSEVCKVADDLCKQLEAGTKSGESASSGDPLAW